MAKNPIDTRELAEMQQRIQDMTRLLLEGSGLHAFLDALESMLGNPVAMIREHDTPWLSAVLRSVEPGNDWPLERSLIFRQSGRGARGGFLLIGGAHRAYVSPIPERKARTACLVLLERGREISPLDALSMDRLAALAGLELANVEAVKEVEGKYHDQFLQDWLSGKIVSEADWKLRAEVCGCVIPDGLHLCAVLAGWPEPPPSEFLRKAAQRLRSEKFRSVGGLLASPLGGDLAIVLPLPPTAFSNEYEAKDTLLSHLADELRTILEAPSLRLYAGRRTIYPEGLHASWMQAKRTRIVAEVCGLEDQTLTYDKLGVYSMLYLIPPGEEREQFLRKYFYPLMQADRKGGGRLSETLETFFRCNGNIKMTSESLYAHYNTVVYRLQKIEQILGISLHDPEDRLQLQLALKLGQIAPTTA